MIHKHRAVADQQVGDDKALGLLSNGLKGVRQEGKGHRGARFPGGQLF